MNKSIGVLVLLVCSYPARSASITDVVLQQWRYDPQSQTVFVPVVNNSQKAVTAFNLSLKVTSGGTVSQYQSGRDFLSSGLLEQRFKDAPKGAFGTVDTPAGGTYEEKLAVPSDFQNISIVLDMVAFSDRTAEATNVPALDRLIQTRKAIAASIEKVNGDDAQEVHRVKENWKAQEHTAQTEDEAQYTIIEHELKQTPAESQKDYWAMKQKERAVWLEQSQLRLVGGR
jgi:flagellar biosynthesis GTPase FlhF